MGMVTTAVTTTTGAATAEDLLPLDTLACIISYLSIPDKRNVALHLNNRAWFRAVQYETRQISLIPRLLPRALCLKPPPRAVGGVDAHDRNHDETNAATSSGDHTVGIEDNGGNCSSSSSSSTCGSMDLNSVLDFVHRACPLLEHLTLQVSARFLFQDNDDNNKDVYSLGRWFLPGRVPTMAKVMIDGPTFARALDTCHSTLKSLRLGMDRGCHHQSLRLMEEERGGGGGGVAGSISNCQSLKILECDFITFSSMKQLTTMLQPLSNTLLVLKLDHVSFATTNTSLDIGDQHLSSLLATTLQQMVHLQQLSLVRHQLQDEHVRTLLGPHSQELRSLTLTYGGGGGGIGGRRVHNQQQFLSDASLEVIAKYCHQNLQHLNVQGNAHMTSTGFRQVIGRCSQLRELLATGCAVSVCEWQHLVVVPPLSSSSLSSPPPAPQLLMVAWARTSQDQALEARGQINVSEELTAAIVASSGRVVFFHNPTTSWEVKGIVKASEDRIGRAAAKQQKRTLATIHPLVAQQKQAQETGDPTFYWGMEPFEALTIEYDE